MSMMSARNSVQLTSKKTVKKFKTTQRTRNVSICSQLPSFHISLTNIAGETSDLKCEKSPNEHDLVEDATILRTLARNWNILSDMAKRKEKCVATRAELFDLIAY